MIFDEDSNLIGGSSGGRRSGGRGARPENWDRFVRSRAEVRRHQQSLNTEEPLDNVDPIINQTLYSTSRETYRSMLRSALSVNVPTRNWKSIWPVYPRPKPNIRSPSAVLDLPNIRNDFCSNLMDWSATDYLTVAFPRAVYLWHPPSNETLRVPANNPTCIKWDPSGKVLFTATMDRFFKLTDVASEKDLIRSGCLSCPIECFISCCAFHPTAPLMLIGCSEGALSRFNMKQGVQFMDAVYDQKSTITSLSFSFDGGLFALTCLDSAAAVYNTLLFQLLFVIKLGATARTLAWHPWSRSCLVVGDSGGIMAAYNPSNENPIQPVATYTPLHDSAILSLSFNPISAELVVSQRIFHGSLDEPLNQWSSVTAETQINVLSSFDRVVDRLKGHLGRVPFLSWNPDGTKLASSGSDETAQIWDFLQHKKDKKRPKPRKINYATAALEVGNRMGLALR